MVNNSMVYPHTDGWEEDFDVSTGYQLQLVNMRHLSHESE